MEKSFFCLLIPSLLSLSFFWRKFFLSDIAYKLLDAEDARA